MKYERRELEGNIHVHLQVTVGQGNWYPFKLYSNVLTNVLSLKI